MNHTTTVESVSLLARMREATQAEHASIEKRVDAFLHVHTPESYCYLLQRLWGFFRPMEESLCAAPSLKSFLPDLDQRMRTGLLEADLLAIGLSLRQIAALPSCVDAPYINSAAQAFGCLYVMEGSTLGGQILVKQIAAIDPSLPSSFFGSHGRNVGMMWKRFKASAEAYNTEYPGELENACLSAQQTFRSFDAFLLLDGELEAGSG